MSPSVTRSLRREDYEHTDPDNSVHQAWRISSNLPLSDFRLTVGPPNISEDLCFEDG